MTCLFWNVPRDVSFIPYPHWTVFSYFCKAFHTFASITPIDSNLSQKLVQGASNETSCSNLHSFNGSAIPFLFQFFFEMRTAKRLSLVKKQCRLLNLTDCRDKRDQVSESHYFTQRGTNLFIFLNRLVLSNLFINYWTSPCLFCFWHCDFNLFIYFYLFVLFFFSLSLFGVINPVWFIWRSAI